MLSRMPLKTQGIILISIPLIFEVFFVVSLGLFIRHGEIQSNKADEQIAIMRSISSMNQLYLEASMCLFLFGLTQKEVFGTQLDRITAKIDDRFAQIEGSLRPHPERLEKLENFKKTNTELIGITKEMKDQLAEGGVDSISFLTDPKQRAKLMNSLIESNGFLNTIVDWEQDDRQKLLETFKASQKNLNLLLSGGLALNLALAVILTLAYRQSLVLNIEKVADNCRKLVDGKPLNETLDGKNEIADLDRVFHAMAAKLKEDERRERAMVEEAIDVICTISDEGKFLSVNRAAERLLGYEKKQLLELSIYDLIKTDQSSDFEKFFKMASAEVLSNVAEFAVRTSNGDFVEFRWSVRHSESGQTAYCVLQDVSIEKEIQQLKNSLVSMITHDLRTPACSIQVSLTMLAMGAYGKLDPSVNASLAKSIDDCGNLIGLISNYLDLEKIASKAFSIRLSEADLSSILDSVCEKGEAIAEKQDIKLSLQDFTRGSSVKADAGLLTSCLNDLLAVILSQNTPCTELLVSLSEKNDDTVEITLSEVEDLPILHALSTDFHDVLARTDDDSWVRFSQWISLAHARAIIELHCGSIVVQSAGNQKKEISLSFKKSPSPTVIQEAKV